MTNRDILTDKLIAATTLVNFTATVDEIKRGEVYLNREHAEAIWQRASILDYRAMKSLGLLDMDFAEHLTKNPAFGEEAKKNFLQGLMQDMKEEKASWKSHRGEAYISSTSFLQEPFAGVARSGALDSFPKEKRFVLREIMRNNSKWGSPHATVGFLDLENLEMSEQDLFFYFNQLGQEPNAIQLLGFISCAESRGAFLEYLAGQENISIPLALAFSMKEEFYTPDLAQRNEAAWSVMRRGFELSASSDILAALVKGSRGEELRHYIKVFVKETMQKSPWELGDVLEELTEEQRDELDKKSIQGLLGAKDRNIRMQGITLLASAAEQTQKPQRNFGFQKRIQKLF